jgi:HPt (histidine-containing phosphotransfer) domain-containing protein
MKRQQPIELFMPPSPPPTLALSMLGGMDMAAMKRAEAAMDGLKGQFGDWIARDVKALIEARANYAKAANADTRGALLRRAHDIKGQAPTFDFPLIARVAGSLARMIGELPPTTALPLSLIDAHVNAIQVTHKQNLKDTNDKIAQALCAELDARVDEVVETATKPR